MTRKHIYTDYSKIDFYVYADRDFEWTQTEQSWILSSFFYGYAASQIPAGFIAGRYGGKWVFGLGNLLTAILTLLTPWAANVSKELFIVIRVIEGLGEVQYFIYRISRFTNVLCFAIHFILFAYFTYLLIILFTILHKGCLLSGLQCTCW